MGPPSVTARQSRLTPDDPIPPDRPSFPPQFIPLPNPSNLAPPLPHRCPTDAPPPSPLPTVPGKARSFPSRRSVPSAAPEPPPPRRPAPSAAASPSPSWPRPRRRLGWDGQGTSTTSRCSSRSPRGWVSPWRTGSPTPPPSPRSRPPVSPPTPSPCCATQATCSRPLCPTSRTPRAPSPSTRSRERLWDVWKGKIVQTLETKPPVTSAEVSHDGQFITATDGSTVKFWDANHAWKGYVVVLAVQHIMMYGFWGKKANNCFETRKGISEEPARGRYERKLYLF